MLLILYFGTYLSGCVDAVAGEDRLCGGSQTKPPPHIDNA